jgi:hypothetical protein
MSGIFKNNKERSSQRQQTRGSPNASTDWGDVEYNKIIEGVKKIYKTKIKPLEVTYNFEGIIPKLSKEKTKTKINKYLY